MKSGLEIIQEILEKVELLDRRFTVVEQNVNELLNRANNSSVTKPKGPSIAGSEPSAASMEAMNASAIKETTNTIKAMGKIKNKEGKALIGVQVTIMKDNGEVVKQTKTNRAGDWMCFLPPGMYKARYFLDKRINTAVGFNITPDQTLIRVAQPKW